MSSYSTHVTEDQRLRVLQMLERDAAGSHNADVLRAGLEAVGHANVSYRRTRDLLDWLADKGLVAIEDRGTHVIARITEAGEAAALGDAAVPGVARPRRRF